MKKIFSIFSALALTLAAVSCSNETDELANNEVGYLKIGIETNSATMTRADAPSDYDARTLVVEVKNKTTNEVVTPTIKKNDEGKYILDGEDYLVLAPGDYTVIAHSANWDGNGSGFNAPYYYGETTIKVKTKTLSTATITCTQANVKVTVSFSDNFKQSFAAATATIKSAITGVKDRAFTMNQTQDVAAYFPVGDLTAVLDVTNTSGETHQDIHSITDVQPRDHYIINYTVADYGHQGGVTVQVDPTTHTYTYTFEVPRKGGTSLAAYSANAWSSFATVTGAITGKKADFDQTKLKVQYKTAAAAEWNDATDVTIDSEDKVSCKITGLTPETDYVYRLAYVSGSDEAISSEVSFTTEAQTALYNGSFELWHYETNKNIAYPTEAIEVKYWSSSNPGSGKALQSLAKMTDKTTDFVHGGTYAAKLASGATMGFLAAASIFTGTFGSLDMDTQTASLNWGVPFTSRPTALKGYMIYKPGKVNITSDSSSLPSDAPAEGEDDHGQIYCALLDIDAPLTVTNADMSTFPDWNTDPRVIAYGALTQKTTQSDWTEFTIDLEYRDLTKTPKYLLIVGSAGKFGDYFHGSSTSVLYLDDFELVYGDTPTVKQ